VSEPWNSDPIVETARPREDERPWEADPVVPVVGNEPAPTTAPVERPWEADPVVSATGETEADDSALSAVGTFYRELAVPTLLGGARDALQGLLDLPEDFGLTGDLPDLPEVPEPTTLGGRMVRDMTQFLAGFVPVFGWLGKAGKLGPIARGAAAGAAADFAVFDGQEERLSNLVQEHPALANPVTEFLASDPDDAAPLGRLKNALEGLGLGAAADGFLSGVRVLRAARAGRRQIATGATPEVVQETVRREARNILDVRDVSSPPPTGPMAREAGGSAATEPGAAGMAARPAMEGGPVLRETLTPEDLLRQTEPEFQTRAAGRNAPEPTREVRVAGNINLDRIESPEDLKNALTVLARTDAPDIAAERAAGTARGEAHTEGVRGLLLASARRTMDSLPRAEAVPEEDMMRALANIEQLRGVVAFSAGQAAEASARLRAYKHIKDAVAQQDYKAMREMVDGLGGNKMVERKIALTAAIDDLEAFANHAPKIWEAKTIDKALEVWRAGLLTGFRTQAANFLSNTLVLGYTVPERAIGASFGALAGGERIHARESLAFANGALKAMRRASSDAWQVFWREAPGPEGAPESVRRTVPGLQMGEELPAGAFKSQEVGRRHAVGGTVGYAVRSPFRALDAADVWFKTITFGGEVEALAIRKALAEGLEGHVLRERVAQIVGHLDEFPDIVAEGNARAAVNTFTTPLHEQEGFIADLAGSISKFTAKHPSFGFVAPFIRTPANIFKFAAERTPAGFFMADMKKAIKAGGAKRQEALAKITLGSSVMGSIAWAAAEGHITGHGPTDPNKRRLWRANNQPYSVRLPGSDTWYSYARFEPLGTLMGIAADGVEIIKNARSEEDWDNIAMLGVTAAANVMTNKTFMQGPTALISALEDPQRFGDRFVEMLGGSTVPTLIADVARANDPVLRNVRSVMDAWLNRVPGASGRLQPILNLWGEEVVREGGALAQVFSPVYVSTADKDPLAAELMRVEYHPGMPGRSINGHDLTPEQFTEYVKMAGRPAKQVLAELVSDPGWAEVPDYYKAERMEAIIGTFRRMARQQMMAKHPELVVPARLEEEMKAVAPAAAGQEPSARTPAQTELVAAAHGLGPVVASTAPRGRVPRATLDAVQAAVRNSARGLVQAKTIGETTETPSVDTERVLQMSRNPGKLMDAIMSRTGSLAADDPEAFAALASQAQRAMDYLAERAPTSAEPPSIFGEKAEAPEHEQAAWRRTVAAALDPLAAVERLGRGELDQEALDTLQALHPPIFETFQAGVLEALAAETEPPDYERRLYLGQILGPGVEPTTAPRFVAAIQSTFGERDPRQGMPGTFPRRNGSQTLTGRESRRKSRNISLAMAERMSGGETLSTPVQELAKR